MNKSFIALLLVAALAFAAAEDLTKTPELNDVEDDKLVKHGPSIDLEENGDDPVKIPKEEEDVETDLSKSKDSHDKIEIPKDKTADVEVSEEEEGDDPVTIPKEDADELAEVDEDLDESKDRRHKGDVSRIRGLLNAIKRKLSRELAHAKRHVSSVTRTENRRVARAHAAYRVATRKSRHETNKRNRDLGRLRAAQRIRHRNIMRARKVQFVNVQRREKELLLIHVIECRLLQLTNNHEAFKGCKRSLHKRARRYNHRMALQNVSQTYTYSGYCSHHSRGGGWARYCTNRREFQKGRLVTAHGNGVITIRRSGVYRLHARAIQYCANWCARHIRTLINGRQRDFAYKQHAHSWVESEVDKMIYLRRGQNVQFHMYSTGSNPYRWHSGNGRGAHSRVQITYMHKKPFHSSMCSASRGRGWHWYCNNRVERTNSHFFQNTHHYIRVKQPGMYRVNARALIYTRGWGPHHQDIRLNGRRISYTHDYKVYWAECKGDVMWPMNAGDRIYVRYYSNNGHAYHSGNYHGSHSATQVSYEGTKNKPVASYYCRSHNRNRRHWRTYCLNGREFDTARRFVRVYGSGMIRILRNGTYRINAWALSHSGYTWRNSRVLINGTYYSYCHTHDNSWSRLGHDFYWRLRRGYRVHVQYRTNGSYQWHAGWTHSRVQISYEGAM